MRYSAIALSLIVMCAVVVFVLYARSKNPAIHPAQARGDLPAIEELKKSGSNMTRQHSVDFYLYFPTEGKARSAALQVEHDGFTVQVRPAATGNSWLCLANKSMVPERYALGQVRASFEALAAASNGEYDGWEAEVVK